MTLPTYRKCSAEGASGAADWLNWVEFDRCETRVANFSISFYVKQLKQINILFFPKRITSPNQLNPDPNLYRDQSIDRKRPYDEFTIAQIEQRKCVSGEAAQNENDKCRQIDGQYGHKNRTGRFGQTQGRNLGNYCHQTRAKCAQINSSIRTFTGNAGQFGTSNLCIRRLLFGGHTIVWQYNPWLGSILDLNEEHEFQGR